MTRPFTDVHAIVFADFGLSVRDPFTDRQVEMLHGAVAPVLVKAGFVRSAEDEASGEARISYVRRTEESDEVVEEFHIHAGYVHLLINDYRGWQVTRGNAMDRLAPVWEVASDPRFELTDSRLVLGYKDAFMNDDPRKNSALDVFTPNRYLPEFVFHAGLFWRQQLTMMDIGKEEDPWSGIWSRLTVEAQVRNLADDGDDEPLLSHWTEITHRQQLAGNSKGDPAVEWSGDMVQRRFDLLHDRNKQVMLQLLSTEMAERVGLREGTL